MVLEDLINPENAESKSRYMIFLGFFYTSLAMALSYFIFKSYSSLFMIFLSAIASIPIIYRVIKMEEQKDLQDVEERVLLKEHGRALKAFMLLFIGATLAFMLWYIVLPPETIKVLYESQTSTIISINGGATTGVSGNAVSPNYFAAFSKIFFNNVKVLLFCILFSFLYGAGAIFILLWNASIVGTAMGKFIRESLATLAMTLGGVKIGSYLQVAYVGLFRYSLHGIPEILAYFVAALAGGIISIAVINHDFSTRKFEHILLDSADLLMLSIFILFIAAIIEVFITPMIFG